MTDLLTHEVAELCGVHPNTIRIYEGRGVIESTRDLNNYRRYELKNALHLKKLINLRMKKGHPLNIDNNEGILGHGFILGKHTLAREKGVQ